MPTVPAQPQARCYLLELPAKLRTRIWEHVLIIRTEPSDDRIGLAHQKDADIQRTKVEVDPRHAHIWRRRRQFETITQIGASVLALLRACQQIHAEAMPIFYTNNHLSLNASDFQRGRAGPTAFFNVLSYSRRSWITRLCVQLYNMFVSDQQAASACKLATTLPRLRELQLQGTCRMLKNKARLKRVIGKLHQVEKLRIVLWEDWRSDPVKDGEIVRELEEATPQAVAKREEKEKDGE